jgi:hypothetical protein
MRSCGYQSNGHPSLGSRLAEPNCTGRGFQYWLPSRAIACAEEG